MLAVGPLVGEALYGRSIPMVTVPADDYARLRTGDWLIVDATAGGVSRRALDGTA